MNKNTLMEQLDIKCVEIGDYYVVSTMPVNSKTHQPMGLLVEARLIESIASMGSTLLIDIRKEHPAGLEINANHISSIQSGLVRGVGKIIHAGRRTHVWQVDIFDDQTKLLCTGRLTVMIVPLIMMSDFIKYRLPGKEIMSNRF